MTVKKLGELLVDREGVRRKEREGTIVGWGSLRQEGKGEGIDSKLGGSGLVGREAH